MKRFATILFVALASCTVGQAFADDQTAGPRVVVPVHDIERGETIADSDITVATVPPNRMRPGLATTKESLVGREARRLLRAGELVRNEDVHMPVLVAKGATVTMIFSGPGISITAIGRAMSEGGLGETVVVQNPVSFRQVSCVVTGPGEVRAADATPIVSPELASNP